MSTALHLGRPDDLERLDALMAACHADTGRTIPDAARQAALRPLLEGIPHGSAYLIGPARAPIGYIVLTFGWSLEFGGLTGVVEELYLRPSVRGRGIASEVLGALPRALTAAGIKAIHALVDAPDERAARLYGRAGFKHRAPLVRVTRTA